jgi:hypothetical protein
VRNVHVVTARVIGNNGSVVDAIARRGLDVALRPRRLMVSLVSLLVVAGLVLATVAALGSSQTAGPPLSFGVYPGPTVGTVGPPVPTLASHPQKELAALAELRGHDRNFVVRLYCGYGDRASLAVFTQTVLPQIRRYTAAGFKVELVVTDQPGATLVAVAVPGFVTFIQQVVDLLSHEPAVVSLQVTNEANDDAGSSDGGSAGIIQALTGGVIDARKEADADRDQQLQIGFSWAYEIGEGSLGFWRELRQAGPSLAAATDWVGVDLYPGTWGPALSSAISPSAVRAWVTQALNTTRRDMAAGGFSTVALHVSECGYPTGPGRSTATQSEVASQMIHTVNDDRARDHVTALRWFDLRDADSADPDVESQYGLLFDNYSPKPAFATYRTLIRQLS